MSLTSRLTRGIKVEGTSFGWLWVMGSPIPKRSNTIDILIIELSSPKNFIGKSLSDLDLINRFRYPANRDQRVGAEKSANEAGNSLSHF